MKAIVIEDEKNIRENLIELLKLYCEDVVICGEAASVEDAVKLYKSTAVDIIFLDIRINGGSGFDFLNRIGSTTSKVIFTTAYDEYAIKALKADAFDYLLKPIDIDELIATVSRVREVAENKEHKIETNQAQKIGLPTSDGIRYIAVNSIIRCQSENYYTWFYLEGNEKILVSKTLKHFENILSSQNFIRIHNSHLINSSKVVKYNSGKGGFVTMTDNSNVEVSIRKKNELLNFLKET